VKDAKVKDAKVKDAKVKDAKVKAVPACCRNGLHFCETSRLSPLVPLARLT
jgi:hypothetical protein